VYNVHNLINQNDHHDHKTKLTSNFKYFFPLPYLNNFPNNNIDYDEMLLKE